MNSRRFEGLMVLLAFLYLISVVDLITKGSPDLAF
jgi:hypothetical protein